MFAFQKEKVKVYIDEKYHHAMDPSIRPHKNKLSKKSNSGNETNIDGIDTLPTGNSAPPSEKPSRASTLVRQMSEEGNSGNNYGKDIKDIPRYPVDCCQPCCYYNLFQLLGLHGNC
jgi:hypothetical protein